MPMVPLFGKSVCRSKKNEQRSKGAFVPPACRFDSNDKKRRGKRRRFLRSFVRRIGLPKPNKKGAQKQRGCLVVRDANRSVSQSVTKQKKRTGKTGKRQSFVRSTCRSVSQTKQKKLRGGGTPTVPSFGKLVCRNKRSSEKQRSVRSSGVSFRLK